MYSFFFVFFFLCLCFCFLSCFIFLNIKNYNFSSDYWGQKRGFASSILIIGGACPGYPPESTPILIHLYADDTQLYIKLSAKDIVNAKSRLAKTLLMLSLA